MRHRRCRPLQHCFAHRCRPRRSSLPVKRLPRRLYALAYTCTLLAAITTTTILTVPRLNVESQFLVSLGELENPYMALADWVRSVTE
jgi:hypothetical protein